MSQEHVAPTDPRIVAALATLQNQIRDRYPDASFTVFEGEDPEGVYLRATVDIDDPDEVMDLVVDTLYQAQVEQELPVYIVPVQPLERASEQVHAQLGRIHPPRFRIVAG